MSHFSLLSSVLARFLARFGKSTFFDIIVHSPALRNLQTLKSQHCFVLCKQCPRLPWLFFVLRATQKQIGMSPSCRIATKYVPDSRPPSSGVHGPSIELLAFFTLAGCARQACLFRPNADPTRGSYKHVSNMSRSWNLFHRFSRLQDWQVSHALKSCLREKNCQPTGLPQFPSFFPPDSLVLVQTQIVL